MLNRSKGKIITEEDMPLLYSELN